MPRNIPVFQRFTKKLSGKVKKSRVKVGVCEKVRNFAPAFERETR